MQKEENKKIILGGKIEIQEKELEEARKKTDELADAYQRLSQLQDTISRGKATPQQFTMAQDIQNTYGNMTQLETSFLRALNKQDAIDQKAQEMKLKYDEINAKVAEYKQKIESVKLEKQVAEVNRIKEGFNNVGGSIQNAVGNVGKLVLGIFSVQSAYMGVRQAISTLSQYNETLANQIQAIKLALVTIIEPVVNFIVGVISKVVSFVGYILKTLFGIDIFARATALSFNKIRSGASGASKAVKEMRKQLAGFDEANVLNKDGTTGLAGGVGGIGGGVNNLSDALADMEKQGEKVFKKFRKWFLGSDKNSLKGIWQDNVKIVQKTIQGWKQTLQPFADWTIKNVWNPTKEGFKKTMQDLSPIIDPIKNAFKDMFENYLKPMWTNFVSFMKTKVVNPIIDVFKPVGASIYNMLVPYANRIIDMINQTFGVLGVNLKHWEYKTVESTDNVETQFGSTMQSIEKNSNTSGKQVEKNINNPLKNVKSEIKDVSKQTLTVNTNTSKIDTFASKLRNIWETLKNIVKGKWEFVLRASGGGGTGAFGSASGGGYRAKGAVFYPSKLPKLAAGGIINQPGRGVPYNGAIIGERGAEAVVPLTDNEQMELLGATIGKYITINANIVNTMNGRVISRELKQVKNEQDFAFNT